MGSAQRFFVQKQNKITILKRKTRIEFVLILRFEKYQISFNPCNLQINVPFMMTPVRRKRKLLAATLFHLKI